MDDEAYCIFFHFVLADLQSDNHQELRITGSENVGDR